MRPLRTIFRDALMRWGLFRAKLSEEDVARVIDAGTRSGAIDKTEHELLKSILQFSDITVKEIMVPRPDIVALDIDTPREGIIRKVIEEGYSRLPVYKGTVDRIVGIVYSKDLLSLMEHQDLIILHDILRPPFFVAESAKVSRLLREFQQHKVHMGIVVDEFGGTEGLVTMEDVIEEIVGDILDEYDEAKKSVVRGSDGSVAIDAALTVAEFNAQFNASIPEAPEYETIAGYIHSVIGRIADQGEEIRAGAFCFTILSKSARRIRQVKVARIVQAATS